MGTMDQVLPLGEAMSGTDLGAPTPAVLLGGPANRPTFSPMLRSTRPARSHRAADGDARKSVLTSRRHQP